MKAERKAVKEWLKTVDREELDAMLQSAIFTPDEQKYIHMRLIRQNWTGLKKVRRMLLITSSLLQNQTER